MIKIHQLNKSFGKQQVLKEISLIFERGQGVALIGPNGSGKSTLIKVLLGLVVANKGEVTFDGRSIKGQSKYRQQIGYMPQMSRFPANMTVLQLFNMMKNLRSDIKKEDYDLDLYKAFQILSLI